MTHPEDGNGSGSGAEGEDEKQGKNKGKGKGRPNFQKKKRKQIKEEMKAAVMGAAQSAGAGNVPAGVKRLIEQWTQPKMDWRALLQQQIESTIKSDFTPKNKQTFLAHGRSSSWHEQ